MGCFQLGIVSIILLFLSDMTVTAFSFPLATKISFLARIIGYVHRTV